MAISVAAATVRPLNSDRSTSLSSTSSSSSMLSHYSSLQFPRQFPKIRIGYRGFSARSRPRILPRGSRKSMGKKIPILVYFFLLGLLQHTILVTHDNKHLLAMADGSPVVPSDEFLEWPKKDNRRFLHAVHRVGDLDRSINFYTEAFGMKLLRKRDIPEEKYSNAFVGFGTEESNFVLELVYNYGVHKYDIGTGFGHFCIATTEIYKLVENIRAKGGNITREPAPVKGAIAVIAFVTDPDGYSFEILQRPPTPERLCQVMLSVADLDRSIKFYEKALGMELQLKFDKPDENYTIAMMGYADQFKTTVFELKYNYGVTEYTKGNGYVQTAISTDDVYKSAAVVSLVTKELGGKITRPPGPIPGINTKITSFVDPDGWKIVLVDNEDFLKELE